MTHGSGDRHGGREAGTFRGPGIFLVRCLLIRRPGQASGWSRGKYAPRVPEATSARVKIIRFRSPAPRGPEQFSALTSSRPPPLLSLSFL